MMDVIYLPAAKNYIKKIKDKKLKALFRKAIDDICNDCNIGEEKKGDLRGIYGYDIFYNKTNYEISYTIEKVNGNTIIVIMAGTRENFYKELKKYMKG